MQFCCRVQSVLGIDGSEGQLYVELLFEQFVYKVKSDLIVSMTVVHICCWWVLLFIEGRKGRFRLFLFER